MPKIKKSKIFNVNFYANMKWFDVAEQPKNIQDLPIEFTKAIKLWKLNNSIHQQEIIELLSPYLKARFILDNLSDWNSLFSTEYSTEIDASEVHILELDFNNFPIPKCKAEATFKLGLLIDPEKYDFDSWQQDHSYFYDAVSFYWDINRNDQTRDLDFTFGENQGVECIPNINNDISTPSLTTSNNISYIKLDGLSSKDRILLIEFLSDHWSDEVKNIGDIKISVGGSLTIEIFEDDIFLLTNALAMKDFDKFIIND